MPRLTKRSISIRECEALVEHRVKKAFICFCFDDEDSLEDDIDHIILAELAVLKAARYSARGAYRQWNSSWERMLEDGTCMSEDNNQVWSNSEIYLGRDKYFDQKEYLLGDSAFSTSEVMVQAFKKGHNSSLSEEKRFFNIKLAKIRIKSEHCIGLLKA